MSKVFKWFSELRVGPSLRCFSSIWLILQLFGLHYFTTIWLNLQLFFNIHSRRVFFGILMPQNKIILLSTLSSVSIAARLFFTSFFACLKLFWKFQNMHTVVFFFNAQSSPPNHIKKVKSQISQAIFLCMVAFCFIKIVSDSKQQFSHVHISSKPSC